jgi:hypothetical protein
MSDISSSFVYADCSKFIPSECEGRMVKRRLSTQPVLTFAAAA